MSGKTTKAPVGKNLNVQVPGETANESEQIRAEELAKLQAELRATEQSKGVGADAPVAARNYREMRADQVDPTTLTAPVLTKDGWVCPATPEKK